MLDASLASPSSVLPSATVSKPKAVAQVDSEVGFGGSGGFSGTDARYQPSRCPRPGAGTLAGMGANHMSQVVFGVDSDAVEARIVRWMRAKGFVLQEGEPLVPLHPEHERGLLLKVSGDTTIVMYSAFMEQERLLYELKRLGGAVLDAWMHDSDVWGYRLFEGLSCTSFWSSNPGYFGVGAMQQEGPDDLAALAAVSGRELPELRKARKTRALFAEGLNERFLAALGVRGAASQYGYLVEERMRPAFDEGFTVRHLWFRKQGRSGLAKLDLAELDFTPTEAGPAVDPLAELSPEEREAVEAAQARAQRQAKIMGWVFWPVGLIFRLLFAPWLWWQQWRMKRQLAAMERGELGDMAPVGEGGFVASPVEEGDDGLLEDPRTGLRLRLPEGAERKQVDRFDMGPGQPFACHLGELRLTLRAMGRQELENLSRWCPPGSTVTQVLDFSGPHPVKLVTFAYGGPSESWRCMGMVKGERAVWVGECGGVGEVPGGVGEVVLGFVQGLRFGGEGKE